MVRFPAEATRTRLDGNGLLGDDLSSGTQVGVAANEGKRIAQREKETLAGNTAKTFRAL